ncbi:hypothetical protein BDB00DRAFT_931672 [Zychaea mexicana]|uniref:uncharacterized protein n=1 Tax=Zychaea mexicana TaxID=64656 RepID=UPI0022FE46E6|nr:uncharacterized protein BDB00DRAFT_931672 [Zychaea mexicana]KAI9489829.1 hypothetical protein BDB00DRAFT_931672 [Zychaea mexicana]
MATARVVPPSAGAAAAGGGAPDLVAQNEELWRIVEKQRIIIQNLQKSLALMTDERDNLLERNQDLEQELVMTTQLDIRRSDPASPESNSHHKHQQQQPREQQQQPEPNKETQHLLAETIEATMLGPVPPPRSPYRQQKDGTPSPSSANSSSSNLGVMASVLERYGTPDSSEAQMGATIVEPSLPATYGYENRSRAPSPAPQQYRHGSNNNKECHSNIPRSPHSVSSNNNDHHHLATIDNNSNTGSNINLPESFSDTTLDLSLPPVVDTMVDKDAQMFAKYQGAVHGKDTSDYCQQQQQRQPQRQHDYYQHSQQQQQKKQHHNETSLSPPPSRKPAVESHHPLSPVEYTNNQQQNYQYNHHQQQQQQQRHHHHYQQASHPPPQIQVDYHQRSSDNDGYLKRSDEDHVQHQQQHTHRQQSEGVRLTGPEQEPTTSQSVGTPAAPSYVPPQQEYQQQFPSSPQGGFSSGPMAGISTKVVGSDTTRNEKGKEVVTFTISVRKAKDIADPNSPLEELWQIQKLYSDFLALDAQLKSQGKSVASKIAKLPDRALFVTHSQSKVDQRKLAIDSYLQHAIRLPLADITDICEFLSSNVMEKQAQQPKVSKYRQGYLAKRGKNFGGWKRRYFLLDGPELKYFESEEGQFLGKISLTEAQIGKQKAAENSKEAPTFKHGFLILEPKKSAPGGVARHVLCAESDEDRDAWVDAMGQHIDQDAVANRQEQSSKKKKSGKSGSDGRRSSLDHTTTSAESVPAAQLRRNSVSHLERLLAGTEALQNQQQQHDDDSGKKDKGRKAFWAKKMFAGSGNGQHANGGQHGKGKVPNGDWRNKDADPPGPKQVFGIPLEDAIKVAKVSDQYELPAIVYRCIDYLEAKNAIQEEGIYRLSGSAVKIRNLKSKFNEEGDVDLLAVGEHHDIHAVSGLLKLWLRELPGNVLTTELLKEFLNVMDLVDRRERINELGRLVSMLPLQNYTLLRTLSAHLIRVVQNAGTNKMTIRNVGIVFSATLGIPTGIFSLLLTEFDYIFWTSDGSGSGPPPISTDDPAFMFPPPPTSIPPPPPVQNMNHHQPHPHHHQQQQQQQHNASSGRVQALQEEPGRSNRNSVSYMYGAPRSIVGLEKKSGSRGTIIVAEDDEVDDLAIDFSDEENITAYRTAERQPYVQPHQFHNNQSSSNSSHPTVDHHHYYASHYY